MYLKSIEVQGFKSFANRLVFEFNKGITGIVGPNGSGKSNIADAVRWVLGEQSARQLRGQKMEDVIFAGTQNRKPLGFAFVSITLDNSDHALPISYDTVTVSRRVFRSGESEYKINGHSCRLRDIQELFFDTGIGKEGYSIIGQGQIDRILSGKPEDRRELFDEAAGIVKYKKRKAYALKDLEEEERNISRARDIAHELEVQLAPLREQSEKARSFLKLRDDLKLYEANMYIVSFDKLKSDGADVEDKLHIIEAQIEDTRSQYEAIKSKYTQVEALMEEYDRKINALQEEAGERAIRLQKLEGSRDLLTSRKENLAGSISQGTGRLGEIRKGISEKAAQIEKLKADLEKYTEEYETSSAQGDKGASELADIRGKSQALREEMEALSAREMDIMGRISGQKNRREHVRAQDEQAALRRSELSSRLIALKSQTSSDTDLAASYREERDRIEADIEKNETAGADLTRQAEDLEKEYSGSAAALAEQQKSFHEGSARYKTLRNITERYEGYSGSIRRVMENKDREKGLIGLVSDIIKVDRDYETAIETALGGSISNIVTEDEDTARRMIEFLKKNRYGRATFLPLTSIRGRKAQASEGVRGEAGFIGMGDELVKTDDRYKNIASFLLGRIYIVDNMDHALAIARKYRYSFRIVTLGGESLNPGGSISGGAYKKTGNLLARHREMDELKAHVDQLSGRIRELAKGLEELDGRRQKMARERQKIRSDHEQLLLGRNTVQMQLSQLEGRNAESEKTIADIEKELARMESDKKERGDILAAIDGQIDDLARQKEETSGRSGQAGQELKKLSQREEELSARNTELKIRYSKLRQRLDFTKENIERNENEKKALAEEIENINSQMDQTRNRSLQLEEEEKELLAQIQDCQRSISRGDEALKQALGERDRCKQEHGSFFDRREEISQTLASLDREQVRLTTQKEKIDERRSSLSDHMWDEYKLTYVGAGELRSEQVQNLPLGRIKKLVEDTRRSMRDLGDVNVASIDQYEAVSGRYETMKAQLDDLTAARAKLNGIIDSLNASMKKQFAEKFALIGEKFDQVFSSLFGGGKGTLSLTDPDDLLGSGIIITAQPPGKKLQNMMQLSGGEKALTAIALLFAIQYLKPSPFCLLDEIEAALDDANVKRFAEYLGNLTKDTQFIVITHRRGTMKAADVLYGITMQEKGVSAMVSVNLIENQLSR